MLRVRLFGNLRIQDDDRKFESLQSNRARELFCYLLLHREHPHARETLAGRFWADCDKDQSRKYLRQALWQVHQSTGVSGSGRKARLFSVDSEFVGWDEQAEVWVDVFCFESAFASLRQTDSGRLSQENADELRRAVALYEGDLMEGCYQDWCLFHRERLQNNYLTMLEKLMDYSELHHDYEEGLSFGERLLNRDKVRERSYIRVMRLQCLAGDRVGAIRQFHRCVAALQEELGVKPSRKTIETYEQICADRLDTAPAPPKGPSATHVDSPTTSSLTTGLQELRSQLLSLQRHVQDQIQSIDAMLGSRPVGSPIERPHSSGLI